LAKAANKKNDQLPKPVPSYQTEIFKTKIKETEKFHKKKKLLRITTCTIYNRAMQHTRCHRKLMQFSLYPPSSNW